MATTAAQTLARLEQKIDALAEQLRRVEETLRLLNGYVREHGEEIATHRIHLNTLDKRVDTVNHKANWIRSLNVALTALLSAIAAAITAALAVIVRSR